MTRFFGDTVGFLLFCTFFGGGIIWRNRTEAGKKTTELEIFV